MDAREYSYEMNKGSFKPLIDLYKWIVNLTLIFISASFAVYTFVIKLGSFAWFFYLGWTCCIVVIVLSFMLIRFYSGYELTIQHVDTIRAHYKETYKFRQIVEIFLALALTSLALGIFLSLSQNSKLNLTDRKEAEITQGLKEALPSGTSVENLISYLDKNKIEHGEYDSMNRTLNAIIRSVERSPVVITDIQITFQFDQKGKLIDFIWKKAFTGL
jgi:hypothetical protein